MKRKKKKEKVTKKHFGPLKELSRSDKGVWVCPNEFVKKFINFDELKNLPGYTEPPKTPDMLYIDRRNRVIWFVEFKSSELSSLKSDNMKYSVRRKILDGLILFYELFGSKYCNFRKVFILVYKDEIDPPEDSPEYIYNYFGYELPLVYPEHLRTEKAKELKDHFVLAEFEKNFLTVAEVMKCSLFLDFFKHNSNIQQLDSLLRDQFQK